LTASEYRGDASLVLPAEKIVAACQRMQGIGFEMLSALTLWTTGHRNSRVSMLSTNLPRSPKACASNTRTGAGHKPNHPNRLHIYRNANWRERELWDMLASRRRAIPTCAAS